VQPPDIPGKDYETTMFHFAKHLRLQAEAGWHSFYVQDEKSKTLCAEVHFHVDGPYANSPLKAPFGSYVFSENLPADTLFDFILFVDDKLQSSGVKTVTIKSLPVAYNPNQSALLHPLLIYAGYTVSRAEVSSGIFVSKVPFEERIDAWEKRKLKQANRAELVSRLIHIEQIESVYYFIDQCRQEKGYSLSMTWQEMEKVASVCYDRIVLAGVFDQDTMVAAAIALNVTESVLYNFYSDHHAGYDRLSPVVMLIEAEYDYCRYHKVDLLDLGTSATGNKPNFPLLDFKLRLGAMPTPKYTFTKQL
jgi:hypothetical protein